MVNQSSPPTQPWQFSPRTLAISCGDAVRVTNASSATHNWSPTQGGFSGSGNLAPSATYTYTFRFTGSFGFFCSIHPYMTGTVTVG